MKTQINLDLILDSIKDKPSWRSNNRGVPTNPKTGLKFSGINLLVLDAVSDKRNYRSKFWATYQQWKSLGITVRENPNEDDDWSTKIVNWKSHIKSSINNNVIKIDRFKLPAFHNVFNADQCFGVDCGKYLILEQTERSDYTQVDKVISKTGANIAHNFKTKNPRYERDSDKIFLPTKKAFKNEAQYYSAKFHELAHWTESRLGWKGEEAQGELIAEIATGFFESEFNLLRDNDFSNHNLWLPFWLEKIQSNPKYLFEAASQASKIVDFVFGFTRISERESEDV